MTVHELLQDTVKKTTWISKHAKVRRSNVHTFQGCNGTLEIRYVRHRTYPCTTMGAADEELSLRIDAGS